MSRKISSPKSKIVNDFNGDNVPEDFTIPEIGIENIDRAVFDLFDSVLDMQVITKGEAKKVPVIFASGERFAFTRRKNPIRDKNNTNILPLISILRKNFDIGPNQNNKKTAIAFRRQPNYVIKYKLAESDRNYQNIINKQGLINQDNVSSEKHFIDRSSLQDALGDTNTTRRNIQFSKGAEINLYQNVNNNIYEIIQTPYPYFISSVYNVTFWVQYMQQGNQLIENVLNRLSTPGGEFPIKTKEGYELVAFISDTINFENNFDQMSESERIIKYSFDLTVPGYLLNNKTSGLPERLRSFYSAPIIDFSYNTVDDKVGHDYLQENEKEKINRHTLTEITSESELSLMRGDKPLESEIFVKNPFVDEAQNEFLRVKNKNVKSGEAVLSSRIIKEIDRQYE